MIDFLPSSSKTTEELNEWFFWHRETTNRFLISVSFGKTKVANQCGLGLFFSFFFVLTSSFPLIFLSSSHWPNGFSQINKKASNICDVTNKRLVNELFTRARTLKKSKRNWKGIRRKIQSRKGKKKNWYGHFTLSVKTFFTLLPTALYKKKRNKSSSDVLPLKNESNLSEIVSIPFDLSVGKVLYTGYIRIIVFWWKSVSCEDFPFWIIDSPA